MLPCESIAPAQPGSTTVVAPKRDEAIYEAVKGLAVPKIREAMSLAVKICGLGTAEATAVAMCMRRGWWMLLFARYSPGQYDA